MVLTSCLPTLDTKRYEETALHKVLDGSVWSIVLTNDFSRLVFLAKTIAWPVACLAKAHWFENFAFRIALTPLIFIGNRFVALRMAWMTLGRHGSQSGNCKTSSSTEV